MKPPRHSPPRRHGLDRVTASLAAGALACLMVLGGCGPQHGAALDRIVPAATS